MEVTIGQFVLTFIHHFVTAIVMFTVDLTLRFRASQVLADV